MEASTTANGDEAISCRTSPTIHGDVAAAANVVLLTGASGFLGGMLAQQLQNDRTVTKVYCPVRSKKGRPGAERLALSGLGSHDKCVHLEVDAGVPSDTTHVILNAYSTRFDETLRVKLVENVAPILEILHDCRRLHKASLQAVVLVSTAYVQPPLPFTAPDHGRLPFLAVEESTTTTTAATTTTGITATQLYDEVLRRDDGARITDLVPDLIPYYQNNSYAFSKHILEHLLLEQYADLPVAIVRPSLICPSQDLRYGFGTKSAIPLMLALAPHCVLMTPRSEGRVNLVFIEDVLRDCAEATFRLARPAVRVEKNNGRESWWHPIILSTSHSNATSLMLFKGVAPYVPRLDIRSAWLRHLLRSIESLLARLIFGAKAAALLQAVYESYDFFMANSWDFAPRYSENVWQIAVEGGRRYHRLQKESPTKKASFLKTPSQSSSSSTALFRLWVASLVVLIGAYIVAPNANVQRVIWASDI